MPASIIFLKNEIVINELRGCRKQRRELNYLTGSSAANYASEELTMIELVSSN